jgi:predicted transposase/invertase (TIGR01784 family)
LTYDKWKIDVLTERGVIEDAKAEGKIEGKAEGKIEGITEGEQKKAVTIAVKMLEKGMSIDDITDMTGLSKQQIEQLKPTKDMIQ